MFTLPLTRAEYQELIGHKYRADAANTAGWVLRDSRGRIYGWHPQEAGSRQWAHRDTAFAAFIPDTRRRRYLARIGHTITATTGINELSELLHRARGDIDNTSHPTTADDDETQEGIFDL